MITYSPTAYILALVVDAIFLNNRSCVYMLFSLFILRKKCSYDSVACYSVSFHGLGGPLIGIKIHGENHSSGSFW
jgi:hypothetical protein